jgi:hypothetical protein
MLTTASASVLGLLMLAAFGLFYFLGIFATARAILAFVGGCLLGTAGFAGGFVSKVAHWAADLANSATSWAFGVGAGAVVLTVLVAIIFIHDLMPKHTAGKRTGWAGLVLALLLVTGVSGIQAANSIPGTVRNGVTTIQRTFGG